MSQTDKDKYQLIPLIYRIPNSWLGIKGEKDLSKITREQRQAVLESKPRVERYTEKLHPRCVLTVCISPPPRSELGQSGLEGVDCIHSPFQWVFHWAKPCECSWLCSQGLNRWWHRAGPYGPRHPPPVLCLPFASGTHFSQGISLIGELRTYKNKGKQSRRQIIIMCHSVYSKTFSSFSKATGNILGYILWAVSWMPKSPTRQRSKLHDDQTVAAMTWVLRPGLKEMETKHLWTERLIIPKTTKMTLNWIPVTNLKMIVRADCAVSACSPLPFCL